MNRKVEEILYEHNAEHMNERITSNKDVRDKQINYRRKELNLRQIFIVLYIAQIVIFILTQIAFEIVKNEKLNQIAGIVAIFTMFGGILLFIWYFLKLYFLMLKYHHYEFLANKRPMKIFFCSTMIALTINGLFILTLINTKTSWDLKQVMNTCNYIENDTEANIFHLLNVLKSIMQLPNVFACLAVVIFKKPDDIL